MGFFISRLSPAAASIYYLVSSQMLFITLSGAAPSFPASDVSFGINLATSYSAIAARYPNGTFVTARAEGSEQYKEVMVRLSLASSQHTAPPYEGWYDEWTDARRRLQRSLRKRLGAPASDDVGALAGQIKAAVNSLEDLIGIRPNDAVVSVPHLVALYQDDIFDACEFAGLNYFELPRWFNPLVWETPAAFAGYGQGLCKSYQVEDKCIEEEQNMSHWNLLSVHYSSTALTTSITSMRSAYRVFEPNYRHRENFSLGYDALTTAPNEEAYWSAVHEELRVMYDLPTLFKEPDMVIVTGESANDSRFLEVLEDAVMLKKPLVFDNDTTLAVAKGTAELRMRGGYVPKNSYTRPEFLESVSVDL